MGRLKTLEDNYVVSVRIEKKIFHLLQDIAALESMNTGKTVSMQEIIRNALNYVYTDNERLRESFKRSRGPSMIKYNKRVDRK